MLQTASENYESQVESKLNGLTAILEPIMIMFLAVVVMIIVFAVVMPMMDLNKVG